MIMPAGLDDERHALADFYPRFFNGFDFLRVIGEQPEGADAEVVEPGTRWLIDELAAVAKKLENERAVLCRLAIFPGGFELEAARAIMTTTDGEAARVILDPAVNEGV